ncbi:cell division protein FtsW [Lachnospiraceae bacterium KM106-2]|nr:cell division protein FtsW [Lachnospiraceae bacterium KM106-2]
MTRTQRERNNKTKKFHSYYDYSLLFLTLFLAAFGLVMIYSTSSYYSEIHFGTPFRFLKQQAIAVCLGIFLMLFVSRIDYHIFLKKLPIINVKPVTGLYILAIFLQVAVLVVGSEVNGAKRWLPLGPLSFQPSELSKIATILFVAYIVQVAPKKVNKLGGFIRIAIYMSPLILLIAKENLSTAIVIVGIMVAVVFVASRKKGYFVGVGLLGLGFVGLFVLLQGYRMERFAVWLNLETHEKGFQILQGLYAIASGGIFGVGLGNSMQKLGFIPESHNDMIFSVICEELGLVGAITLIIIFVLVIWRLFIISISAPDLFGGLICVGILAHIAIQVMINIAVVTNSIPSTGIPLPFISYGGTSVTILIAEMGIALGVSNQIKYER